MSVATTAISKTCPDCKKTYPWQEQHVCEAKSAAADAAVNDPLVGAVLGERYRIDSFLSSGGMGVVYKGRHVVLDKPVAVKLLRESQDPVAQQRFLLEAKSACHIGHEHIVDINDFGVLEDGRPYLVMEFLQGQSLETLLQKQGSLPWSRVCRIGEQIARGLQAVHEKGIMHRDLKPGNIFLLDRAKRDFVKILDFGIAKVMAGTRETLSDGGKPLVANMRQTTQGTVLGTPEYLSPEQAAGEAIDARVDIYALGCILYEMLTGELPFAGKTAFEVMNKHLSSPPMPPRQRRPENAAGIPVGLEKIVLSMMQKKPANRFPSMRAVEQALREVAASMQVAEAKVEPASSNKATLVMSPVAEPPLASPPAAAPGRARPAADSSPDDQKTRPLLPAIKPAEEPAASEPASNAARTMLMPPPGNKPGSTPTPRLLERIEYRIKSNSAPDLGRSPFWQRIPWLFAIVRWFKRLFS